MNYTVYSPTDELISTESSAEKAHKAAQEYFQNGTVEDLVEIRNDLKTYNEAFVRDATFSSQVCTIRVLEE